MDGNAPDLFDALEAEQRRIEDERKALDEREDALHRARQALLGATPRKRATEPRKRTRAGTQQKAAAHHLQAITDYMRRQTRARQADVAKDLQLNSGTVSLALRQLEADGVVKSLERKDRGSVVWQLAGRSTVVEPGAGTREGRLVGSA